MSKQVWKPSNLLAPVPAVMITVQDKAGNDNVLTVAWAGTINSDPVMVSISVRKERHSHHMLMETGEFVVNLVGKDLVKAADYCGVRSGRDEDKFKAMGLTKEKASAVAPVLIKESPLQLECRVKQVIELGSHDLFLAEVVAVDVDEAILDASGRLELERANLVSYIHGRYYETGAELGGFGHSVRKKK